MLTFAHKQVSPPAILLIAGDQDYAYALSLLQNHNHTTCVLRRHGKFSKGLDPYTDIVLGWEETFGLDKTSTKDFVKPLELTSKSVIATTKPPPPAPPSTAATADAVDTPKVLDIL